MGGRNGEAYKLKGGVPWRSRGGYRTRPHRSGDRGLLPVKSARGARRGGEGSARGTGEEGDAI